MIVFWTYFDTLINVLTAELELSYIDTGSFQGQVLQIDIFMFQTRKYLNIDCFDNDRHLQQLFICTANITNCSHRVLLLSLSGK